MRGLVTRSKLGAFCLASLMLGACVDLRAQVTVLLEEPYSYDATFAGTGHAAIYLSRVCAESPTVLRRCKPGEEGVVISRYHGIAGHDWIAIPLIPYLYAVQDADSIPLVANQKLVELLRERYLSTLTLPPEKSYGAEPRYQLAGSAYDRTLYGFRIATRPEQDDALIRKLNSSPNQESYELVRRNCADFVKQIVNFYYPHAIHRSIIADLGLMTPKQSAKSLVHFSRHHAQLQLTTFVVPQVPGLKRSKPVHGVLESVLLAKKYVTPILFLHPFVIGSVEAAYLTGWRFNPGKGARIFDPTSRDPMRSLEPPLTNAQRRAYEGLLATTQVAGSETGDVPSWWKLQSSGKPYVDLQGMPFLNVDLDGQELPVGLCRTNALRVSSPELVEDLVRARLEVELKANPARASETDIKKDWNLLEAAREESQATLRQQR
jgi:hypothetical protein